MKCFHCDKKGHIKRNCRKLAGRDEGFQASAKIAVCDNDSDTRDVLVATEVQAAKIESERTSDED